MAKQKQWKVEDMIAAIEAAAKTFCVDPWLQGRVQHGQRHLLKEDTFILHDSVLFSLYQKDGKGLCMGHRKA